MTKKEKEIQNALGLLKTYTGYVRVHNNTATWPKIYYKDYKVQDVNISGAKEQLNRIVKSTQDNTTAASLSYIVLGRDDTDMRNNWRRVVSIYND